MSVPAELMALLQGGGGTHQMPDGSMMADSAMAVDGPPPGEAAPTGGSPLYGGGGVGGSNTDALRGALDALQTYSQGEDDEQNIQTVLKCITALQAILADEEKMVDGALGGKTDARAMRRLTGGEGGGAAAAGPQY